LKNSKPLVSVIIPCYNVDKYVVKAIISIIKQTYKNLEIWIIDDASTDDTLKKINSFTDSRIKVVAYKQNTQKVGAVNEVLQKVTGDYIAFQDADDWSEPQRIEEQLKEFIKDDKLGVCFTNYTCRGSKTPSAEKISLTNEELRREFLNFFSERVEGTAPTNCPSMMISKSALKKTGGYHPYFSGRVAEDIQWIYRILKDFKGITINKRLYNYLSREGSFTQIQSTGIKPKYAYSWQLLSKIIQKDVYEGIDVLAPENKELLNELELEACEDALGERIQLMNEMKISYEQSASFKIGKFLLTPVRILKSLWSHTS
jgi:glycosyltransferase involved in cell wall biosynthesis